MLPPVLLKLRLIITPNAHNVSPKPTLTQGTGNNARVTWPFRGSPLVAGASEYFVLDRWNTLFSTKGKGFRSLLRKAGYPVYLVDEFRTSCQCSHCQTEGAKCEKFRVRLDPHRNRAIEERRLRLVHGLLACKTCGRLWNRDVNSSINIARLTRQALETLGRPAYLSRQSQPPEADSAVASTA